MGRGARNRRHRAFRCVIYYSRKDKCWVAHSLDLDQIGTGDCVLDALVGLLRAVDHVYHYAQKDPSLCVYRDAPDSVWDMFKTAQQLPGEIFEIAHKIVHHTWPEDIHADFDTKKNQKFKHQLKPAMA